MTKAFLSQNFDTVFQYHFLISADGQTLLASANTEPKTGRSAFAFLPALDDFRKINETDVVAVIKNIKPR